MQYPYLNQIEAATRGVLLEKMFLEIRNFAKFTGKHLCQSPFFNKVAGLRLATLLKKRLWHRYFPVNFVKFLRTRFSQNTSGRHRAPLLLNQTFHRLFIDNVIKKGCISSLIFLTSFLINQAMENILTRIEKLQSRLDRKDQLLEGYDRDLKNLR